MNKNENKTVKKQVDWVITLLPLITICILCVVFFMAPGKSNDVLSNIRFMLGDTFGVYYLIIGLVAFVMTDAFENSRTCSGDGSYSLAF